MCNIVEGCLLIMRVWIFVLNEKNGLLLIWHTSPLQSSSQSASQSLHNFGNSSAILTTFEMGFNRLTCL